MAYTPGEQIGFSPFKVPDKCFDCPNATEIIAQGLTALRGLRKYGERAAHLPQGSFTVPKTQHNELMVNDDAYRRLAETYTGDKSTDIEIYRDCPGATADQTPQGAVYHCHYPPFMNGSKTPTRDEELLPPAAEG